MFTDSGIVNETWELLVQNPILSCAALLGVSMLLGVWMQKASMDRRKLRNTPHLHRLQVSVIGVLHGVT